VYHIYLALYPARIVYSAWFKCKPRNSLSEVLFIVVTNKVLSVSGSCVVKRSCYCRVLSLSTMFYCCGESSALVVIYLIVLSKQVVG